MATTHSPLRSHILFALCLARSRLASFPFNTEASRLPLSILHSLPISIYLLVLVVGHMALKPAKLFKQHSFAEFRARVRCGGSKGVAMGKPLRFPGITQELQDILDANMDEAPARRRAREAFKDIELSIDHYLFKVPYDGLKMEEVYKVNSRGLEIFTKSWLPKTFPPKAVICFCHGYGDTCTFFVEGIARKLASFGYGVFAMDYPGFGLSEGLHGYIPSFDKLVDDVIEHYSSLKENPEFQTLPFFLFGESMGGAVALKMHLKQPNAWNGAILAAPMCKIADDMVPPWLVTQILLGIAKYFPKQKLVPQKNLAEMAFRDLSKRKQAAYNVISYRHRPRLGTALELLRTTQEIEHRLKDVSLPLLILHGEADVVTDPSVSKVLYKKASSSDKTLNIYMDAYHSLLEGELDEMIHRVFTDIIAWLDARSIKA